MNLEIKALSKKYGEKQVLEDFSCSFGEGITGVLGPNGAGKSTLMGLIADVVKRDGGQILYDGLDIIELGKKYRSILGYMPQEQGLYDDLSGKAFLMYMAQLKGVKRKEANDKVNELLELVSLKNVSNRKLGTYSGGMRQRILLCQALLGKPKVIILDEPTAGMDVEERVKVAEYMKEFSKKRIVLWSTHIVSDIEYTASNILIMKNGKNIICATPKELLENGRKENISQVYMEYMK